MTFIRKLKHEFVQERVSLTSGLWASIWLYLPLAAPMSSMLSGRVDKASIDSDTKLSMACVWPGIMWTCTNKKEKEREGKKLRIPSDLVSVHTPNVK